MRKWYHVIPAAFTPDECASLVKYAQTHKVQEATVGHGGTNKVDPNIRLGLVRWLKRSDQNLSGLYSIIEAETHRANADFFGKDIRSFNDVQFTEYPAGALYNWHQDDNQVSTDLRPFDRVLSVCIQLSNRNSYSGGEFWINPRTQQVVQEFVNLGDMIIFPSSLWHRVAPVTENQRNSLVTWWLGPR